MGNAVFCPNCGEIIGGWDDDAVDPCKCDTYPHDVWLTDKGMLTTCHQCRSHTVVPVKFAGSWEAYVECEWCKAGHFVYVETRGYDVEIFDADGKNHAKGAFFT